MVHTTHTSGLGGFCGVGGSVVRGNWSLGSREDWEDARFAALVGELGRSMKRGA